MKVLKILGLGTALTGSPFALAWHCDRCGLEHEGPVCPLVTLLDKYDPNGDYNRHDENELWKIINEHRHDHMYNRLGFLYLRSDDIHDIQDADDLRFVQEALWIKAKDMGIPLEFDRHFDKSDFANQKTPYSIYLTIMTKVINKSDLRLMQEAIWERARELGLEPEYPRMRSEDNEAFDLYYHP